MFQAVEILKTAREILMKVRYFPYSKYSILILPCDTYKLQSVRFMNTAIQKLLLGLSKASSYISFIINKIEHWQHQHHWFTHETCVLIQSVSKKLLWINVPSSTIILHLFLDYQRQKERTVHQVSELSCMKEHVA